MSNFKSVSQTRIHHAQNRIDDFVENKYRVATSHQITPSHRDTEIYITNIANILKIYYMYYKFWFKFKKNIQCSLFWSSER